MSASVLRRVVRGQRRRIAISSLGGITHQGTEALVPVFIGIIIDRAVEPSDSGQLWLWIALLALLFVVLNRAYALQFTVGIKAIETAEHDLRLAIADRVLHPGGLGGRQHGELVSIAGSDAERTVLGIQGIIMLAAATSAFTVGAVVLLSISLPLGLLVLVGMPPVLYGVQRAAGIVHARAGAEQAAAADASAVATDLVRGARILKGLGSEGIAAERYHTASGGYLRATLRAASASALLEGVNVVVGGVLLAVVAIVGGHLALDGTISVGDFVAAVGLTQFLQGPIIRVGFAFGVLAQARASAARIGAVLDAPPVVAGGDAQLPATPAGHLAVDGAGLRLQAGPGEHVGVLADPPDAAALLDLLGTRAAANGTTVTLDGVALADVPLEAAHRAVLVADHDGELFEGTVAENAGTDDAAVLAAAGAGDIDPGAPVGERGGALSGGQRQRVALARALALDPPVLVLHDPTTAVDAVTEARIARGVRSLRAGRTTVLVAASPALLAACDRVVVLRDFAVAAEGTHGHLAATDAAYREAVLQ